MKVLITGAAGFIGSNLVHLLFNERPSWKLTALDALTYAGNLKNLEPLLSQEQISFAHLDINDSEAIDKFLSSEKFDIVFHLAAESHVDRSIHSAAEFIRTNVLGTENLLSAARASGVGRFIHISTDEVYGSLGATGLFTEETPLDPTSPYAASKASSDLVALAYYKTHKLPVMVTRCTNNYGPYQFPEKFIPLFIANALENKPLPLYGDGMNVRSWLHVKDHCTALLRVAEAGRPGEVYNIGPNQVLPGQMGRSSATSSSGTEPRQTDINREVPNLEVANQLLEILEKPKSLIKFITDRPAHDFRYAVDTAKIEKELGWHAKISFADGLKDTVAWYLSNRAWWEEIRSGDYREYYRKQYGER